jgi:RNA polymerase sigma-70 factor (sigma-E family)
VSQRDDEFTAYVAARSSGLLRLAYVLTGNRGDAEDLVQVALTKAYVAWPRIQSEYAVDSYVRTCLVRAHFAGRRRRQLSLVRLATDPQDRGTDAALTAVEDRDHLWQALRGLPPRQRTVIVLKYFEDLDEASIASLMKCSRGTVKSQASKALKTLQNTHPIDANSTTDPQARR